MARPHHLSFLRLGHIGSSHRWALTWPSHVLAVFVAQWCRNEVLPFCPSCRTRKATAGTALKGLSVLCHCHTIDSPLAGGQTQYSAEARGWTRVGVLRSLHFLTDAAFCPLSSSFMPERIQLSVTEPRVYREAVAASPVVI